MDNKELIEKCTPILNDKFKNYVEREEELLMYCQGHIDAESKYMIGNESIKYTTSENYPSLLPISLEILSNTPSFNIVILNKDKKIKVERHRISYDLPADLVQELKNSSRENGIGAIEKILVKKSSSYLEEEILKILSISGEDKIEMRSKTLVESISVISEATLQPRLCVTLSFGFKKYKW